MTGPISRRELLKAAGGMTFLGLAPMGRGLFAAFRAPGVLDDRLPIFTALPYIQPGEGSRLTEGVETVVLAWQTDTTPATFTVVYGPTTLYGRTADVSVAHRLDTGADDAEDRLNYVARLTGLGLGKTYYYRVMAGERLIAEGYCTTRKPRGARTRLVAFGDNSYGEISDRAIAYHAYQAHPDFVMNTGDNVYEGGLDNEYARYFFPVYNADVAGPRLGAPLLRSIPFYAVIANHDVHAKDAAHHPVADFGRDPDSLAYFTNLHLPLNGLDHPQPVPITGPKEILDAFRGCAGPRFPRMANYSFDYGDLHLLCLDSNVYVDPTHPALTAWIEADLRGTDAPWKFVVFHHPCFNVGTEHYLEQHMRVLAPLFEHTGVHLVLHGHEHTYQRTRPIRFAPRGPGAAGATNSKERLVPGAFTVDLAFDGNKVTRPDGVIYLTTGAGGKHLYDPGYTDEPSKWRHAEDDNVEYVARMVTDRHSLTVIDVDSASLLIRQIDQWGDEIDRLRVTQS